MVSYESALAPFPELAVIVPAYCEADINFCLDSLFANQGFAFQVIVIVVINHSIDAPEETKIFHRGQAKALKEKYTDLSSAIHFQVIEAELPTKIAGVGMARKIGLDYAAARFHQINHPHGILVSLDADTVVCFNYLSTLYTTFRKHKLNAASIYFEHRQDSANLSAISDYELHLRLYINGQRIAGYPLAFQSVGSAMAFTAEAYTKQGGMVKNKAGEDFYFMQKLMPLGCLADLVETTVMPSSRESDRVPFGTGRAVKQYQQLGIQLTYHPESYLYFQDMVSFLENMALEPQKINAFEGLHHHLRDFLDQIDFLKTVSSISKQASSSEALRKRIYNWFNPFMVMKYFHFMRGQGFPDRAIQEVLNTLMNIHGLEICQDRADCLAVLRLKDRTRPQYLTPSCRLIPLV